MPSAEDVQKYVRIGVYWFSGMLTGYGLVDATWAPIVISGGTFAANFTWTLYGGRLIAKLNEIAKYDEVAKVQIRPSAVVDRPELIKDTATKVVTAPLPSTGTTGL